MIQLCLRRVKSRACLFCQFFAWTRLMTDSMKSCEGVSQSLDVKKSLFFCQKENKTRLYFSSIYRQHFVSHQFKGISTQECLFPYAFTYMDLTSLTAFPRNKPLDDMSEYTDIASSRPKACSGEAAECLSLSCNKMFS